MRFEGWESYFYPAPDDSTLRNLYGERDRQTLKDLEDTETFLQETAIRLGRITIPRTYDAEHVRAIHRELFKNVYEWAGEYRDVELRKGATDFADRSEIPALLAGVQRLVHETSWGELNQEDFARAAAGTFLLLNHAHPFREGTGRTTKLFLEHVSEQSQWQLDFAPVNPLIGRWVWNRRSAATLSGTEPRTPDLVPMQDLFTVLSSRRPMTLDPDAAQRLGLSPAREASPTNTHDLLREILNLPARRTPSRSDADAVRDERKPQLSELATMLRERRARHPRQPGNAPPRPGPQL